MLIISFSVTFKTFDKGKPLVHQKWLVLHYSLRVDICQVNYSKTKLLAVHSRNRADVIYKELKERPVSLGGDVSHAKKPGCLLWEFG